MIVNEFATSFGIYNTGSAQNGKMLGSYRLLQAELNENVSNIHAVVFFQQTNDSLAQFVIYGSQNEDSLSKFGIIQLYVLVTFCQYDGFGLLLSHGDVFKVGVIASLQFHKYRTSFSNFNFLVFVALLVQKYKNMLSIQIYQKIYYVKF